MRNGTAPHLRRREKDILASLDFAAGEYIVGGSRYAPASIFGVSVLDAASIYDPAKIVAGTGLTTAAVPVGLIGDLIPILTGGCSAIFDFSTLADNAAGAVRLNIADSSAMNHQLAVRATGGSAFKAQIDLAFNNYGTFQQQRFGSCVVKGIYRMAATLDLRAPMMALDGRVSDKLTQVPSAFAFTGATISCGTNFTLQKLTLVRPVLDPALLKAMSVIGRIRSR